jgi:tRNA (guanine37-N1)-methyltransferase
VSTYRFSDFVAPKERIDVPTCGPGPGMVLRAEVVTAAIEKAQADHGAGRVVFFSPSGELLTQRSAESFVAGMVSNGVVASSARHPGQNEGRAFVVPDSSSTKSESARSGDQTQHIILVCARYEGVDCRVEEEFADAIVSVGDFVLMDGDIPAQIFAETVLRCFPGILGNTYSLTADSFQGPLVDYPAYGQPREWRGREVPEVLFSGNHEKINEWRENDAVQRSVKDHFGWLRRSMMEKRLRDKVAETMPPHYVILMHDHVMIGKKEGLKEGTTSVTTIDLHDIARSACTYNVQKFFIVTPLHDQQKQLQVFFQFWQTAQGKDYNINRYDAMRRVFVVESIEEAEAMIRDDNNDRKPLRIATSAKAFDGVPALDYHEQGEAWQHDRPVSLIFGTGQGLTENFLQTCDFLLLPVYGFSGYNHLSVRSAVAIILDRWLGWYKPKS